MSRIFLLLMIVSLAVFALGGCNVNSNGESTDTYSAEKDTESVEESYYNSSLFYTEDGFTQYSGSETLTGIDVSYWQGDIDWEAVSDAGIDFVIIRVGYRGSTAGELYIDDYFVQNIEGALHAGLEVGVYFYSQAISVTEAFEEANFVLNAIEGYDISFPVVFDWETSGSEDVRTSSVDTDTLCSCAKMFCSTIENAGYSPMIYFNSSLSYHYDLYAILDYDFWYAEYSDYPQFTLECRLWQYTATGQVDGISGTVDLNIWFVTS